MGRRARLLQVAWDAVRARSGGPDAIASRRDRRLAEMLAHARRTPFYRRHWTGVRGEARLADVPPVTKQEGVEGFDDSVTESSNPSTHTSWDTGGRSARRAPDGAPAQWRR